MPVRRNIRQGDYLTVDDFTNETHYASEMTRDYLGNWVKATDADPIQPQLFARPVDDPQPVEIYQPLTGIPPASLFQSAVVGDTDVPAPTGPASHLFPYNLAIPNMAVGSSFIVR